MSKLNLFLSKQCRVNKIAKHKMITERSMGLKSINVSSQEDFGEYINIECPYMKGLSLIITTRKDK